MKGSRRAFSVLGLAVLLLLGTGTDVLAATARPRVLPPRARPFGLTYEQWAARWWQWALAIPEDQNPMLDPTGEDCAVGQSGRVWFLAGTFGGGPATRVCTVPAGKALFFPIVNAVFVATEPGETEAIAHEVLREHIDQVDVSTLAVEVNGVPIPNLGRYRAHSATFPVVFPEDNVFGVPAGFYPIAAADGYWIMLAPLPPGTHTVHFRGELPNGTLLDVTYTLIVTRGR
ncbi:MAG TPA: hypothetical protein VHG90_08945 [Acidimicrobiales bacterium]|nr:hypothetical protein [Acidimicrobiales bacterium]